MLANMRQIIIEGKVIKGEGYGRKLGFPTANLDRRQFVQEKVRVTLGVYAGKVQIHPSKKFIKAAVVIGPLDKKGLPKIEAHILGFWGDLYGKRMTVVLEKFLRPWKVFKTEELLREQIKKDINRVKGEN